MNLLTLPFRLPLLPVRGVIRLAELIQEEAERQLYDPSAVRRQLEEVEETAERGRLSEEDVAQAEREALERLLPEEPAGAPTGAPPSGEER